MLPDIAGILLAALSLSLIFIPKELRVLEAEKWRWLRWTLAISFAIVGIGGVISNSKQKADDKKSRQQLEGDVKSLKGQIADIKANTDILVIAAGSVPPQTSLAPQRPTFEKSLGFLQLSRIEIRTREVIAGQPLSANIYLINKGAEPVYDAVRVFAVGLMAPIGTDDLDTLDKKVHDKLLKTALRETKPIGHTVGVGEEIWNTLNTAEPLTQEQVDRFMQGKARFYVYAWARWKGGQRDLDVCRWLQPPPTVNALGTPAVWHDCVY